MSDDRFTGWRQKDRLTAFEEEHVERFLQLTDLRAEARLAHSTGAGRRVKAAVIGEGDGVFTPEAKGEADAGWICYIVAEK